MWNEFSNPEAQDYDINTALNEEGYEETANNDDQNNDLAQELCELIGILEDGEVPPYGLTYDEYFHPTRETINKVKKTMSEEEQTHYHR